MTEAYDTVRLCVVKPGYTVFGHQVVTTEEIHIIIDLHHSSSAAVSDPPHAPAASSDPLTARYIQELTTQQNPLFRLHALDVVVRSVAKEGQKTSLWADYLHGAGIRAGLGKYRPTRTKPQRRGCCID